MNPPMKVDRATAAGWIRAVAVQQWDGPLAEQGFTRRADALTYSRRVADGGRHRIVLDLAVRPPVCRDGFQLIVQGDAVFRSVADRTAELMGSAANGWGRTGVVDSTTIESLPARVPWLLFRNENELADLAPTLGSLLVSPLVPFLDERASVRGLVDSLSAQWTKYSRSNSTSWIPLIIAAGELVLDRPHEALDVLARAYPPGSAGRRKYPEALTMAATWAGENLDEVDARLAPLIEPPLTYELTVAGAGGPVPDPRLSDLDRAVRGLTEDRFYAILQRSDGVYAQVGYGPRAGVAPGWYALEHHQDVHWRADTTDVWAAVAFLHHFVMGNEKWRVGQEWRRLQL